MAPDKERDGASDAQAPQGGASGGVPELGGSIDTCGGNLPAIGGERGRVELPAGGELALERAGARVPEPQDPIVSRRSDAGAVGAERRPVHLSRVSAELEHRLAG